MTDTAVATEPGRRRPAVVVAATAAIAALLVTALVWRPWRSTVSALADLGRAPAFSLTDQNGRAVTDAAFAGKIQLVAFLFPFCSTYCPFTTHQLAVVEGKLAAAGLADKVQFVAFNLAPADSGPSEMATYLRQYGVDPADPHWSFLTGTQAAVDAAVRDGYRVDYVKTPLVTGHPNGADAVPVRPNALADARHVQFDIVHNEVVQLVGPDGVVRGSFDHVVELTPDELYDAVTRLIAAHR